MREVANAMYDERERSGAPLVEPEFPGPPMSSTPSGGRSVPGTCPPATGPSDTSAPDTAGRESVASGAAAPVRQPTFRQVLGIGEFRALFGTFVLSTVGDELARVALAVLVYHRTSSPLLSAITFAIGYLPWLLGGPVLSALADRLPRHRVLIATDAVRAVLVAAMVVPHAPLPVLLALLFLVSLGAPPFESARSALQADILDDDQYAVASSMTNVSLQLTQVAGFVLAGALVALFSPAAALLFDAATFVVSAAWLAARLQRRPAPLADGDGPRPSLWRDAVEGLRFVARTARPRAILGVLWAGTLFLYAPEGLAAPFATQLGQGASAVGVLLAANPLGVTVGGLLIVRLAAPRRERLVVPLVVLSLGVLVAAGLVAGTAGAGRSAYLVVVGLMFVSGLASAWFIPLQAAFMREVPPAFRGRAFGVAVSGLYAVQGIGVLTAGALAEGLRPSGVVAVSGALGILAVGLPLLAYARSTPAVAEEPAPAAASVT